MLPDNDSYKEFIKSFVSKGQVAEIDIIHVDKEISYTWKGELEWPVFVGHPFIYMNRDDEKNPSPEIMNIGIPIHILYWSAENHCFACVRKDVYAKS